MDLNSNIIQLNVKSVSEVCREISSRVKQRRLELNLSQQGLASRSGVNIETYRKFERTGQIALMNLVKIGLALQSLDDFDILFSQEKYQNIEDVIQRKAVNRKRGKKHDSN